MKDPRTARLIMELRQAGITDTRLLRAMELVPRHLFIGDNLFQQAWEDRALPIGCGQTISQPLVVAAMTQSLELSDMHKVLEVGTGSGYQAAILSRLCRRVYSLERHRDLYLAAEEHLLSLGIKNATLRMGDGWKGWPEQAPFDRIIVTAAAYEVPQVLFEQLAPGGHLVVPVGPEFEVQELRRYTKDPVSGVMKMVDLFPVRFVPMLHGLGNPGRVPS